MGTEAPKDGASSKASPDRSGWRQLIWFSRISDSRAMAGKIFGLQTSGKSLVSRSSSSILASTWARE